MTTDEVKTIKIECTGTENIDIDSLIELQGNLKELSTEGYTRLKDSIIKYGFSFPMFVWKNEGKNYIIDAHQRKKTLQKLREEGYNIPPLPTVFINAKDRIEAKEKLLQLNSNYGKITQDGLYEFLNEPGAELDFELLEDIDLPEINMSEFNNEFCDNKDGVTEDPEKDIKSIFEIVIGCSSETEQEKFYNDLTNEGYKCRILTL